MSKPNGGAAFPGTYTARSDQGRGPVTEFHDKGMSLRDYFASGALHGMLAWPGDEGSGSYHSNSDPKNTASMAYEYADAMLAARSA